MIINPTVPIGLGTEPNRKRVIPIRGCLHFGCTIPSALFTLFQYESYKPPKTKKNGLYGKQTLWRDCRPGWRQHKRRVWAKSLYDASAPRADSEVPGIKSSCFPPFLFYHRNRVGSFQENRLHDDPAQGREAKSSSWKYASYYETVVIFRPTRSVDILYDQEYYHLLASPNGTSNRGL